MIDSAPTTTASVLTDEMLARFHERAPIYDRENRFFSEDFEELRAAGYLLSAVPRELGGRGMSLAEIAREQRRIAYAAPATAIAVNMHFYWTGVVADRFGRRGLLLAGYLVTACGAMSLGASTVLWQFWAAVALLRVGQAVNDAMAPALATDLLPASALGRYLPRLKATNWLAGMLSFAGAGYAMGQLGTGPVFLIAGASAVIAAGLLALLPGGRRILLQYEPSV